MASGPALLASLELARLGARTTPNHDPPQLFPAAVVPPIRADVCGVAGRMDAASALPWTGLHRSLGSWYSVHAHFGTVHWVLVRCSRRGCPQATHLWRPPSTIESDFMDSPLI